MLVRQLRVIVSLNSMTTSHFKESGNMSEIKEVMVEPNIYLRGNRHIVRYSGKYVGSFASLAAARMELGNTKISNVKAGRAPTGIMKRVANDKNFSPTFQKLLSQRL